MKQKDILIIAVTIFLTVVAWIVVEIRTVRQETPTEAEIQSSQLEYTVDTALLDELEKRTP